MPCKTSQVLAILASLLPAALIPAQITASHQDEVHGFRLKVPKRYKRLPVEKDRHCVLLHWVCKQGYAVKGVRWTHRPSIRVLYLPPATKAKDAGAEKAGTPAAPAQSVDQYADYRDYLGRNLTGWLTFGKPERSEVDGIRCTKVKIRRRDPT